MRNILFIVIVLVSVFTSFAQTAQVDIPIIAVIGQNTRPLNVGLDTAATNGIDIALGESILPPIPPAGAYDARFDLYPYTQNYYETWKDYRPVITFPFSGDVQHKLMWQLATGTDKIILNYSLPAGASMNIKDLFGGVVFNSGNLTGSGSYTINEPYDKAFITMTYTNISPSTDINHEENSQPSEFKLFNNYPNPFNPSTTITFTLPRASHVKAAVYDILGNEVKILFDEFVNAGKYNTTWDGTNTSGSKMSSGIYLCKMTAGEFTESIQMILLK